jgi:hypothetical protein
MDELEYRALPISSRSRNRLKNLDAERLRRFRRKTKAEPDKVYEHYRDELIKGRLRDYWAYLQDTPGTSEQRAQWLHQHFARLLDEDASTAFRLVAERLPSRQRDYERVRYELTSVLADEICEEVLRECGGELAPTPSERKKRGRPQTIPDERKALALAVKQSGGSNRDAAMMLYSAQYPKPQQVKNVGTILKHYQEKLKRHKRAESLRNTNKNGG